jgi:hypothetical protein
MGRREGGFPEGVYGCEMRDAACRIFSFGRPGKFPDFFCKIFLVARIILGKFFQKRFLKIIFGVGNYFREKFCAGPLNYFS